MRPRGYLVPNELFFIVDSSRTARIDAGTWRLRIEGSGVSQPREFSSDDILGMPSTSAIRFVECGGNGRRFFQDSYGKPVPGAQFNLGLIGVAEWTGVPLREILERAGVRRSARDVMPEGLDEAKVRRPIALGKALADDTLVVYAMNGQVLPPDYGFPLRLLVPGWIGVANVKWVGRIEVSEQPIYTRWNTDKSSEVTTAADAGHRNARIAVDMGGTFTDLVLVRGTGEAHIAKTRSTPADPPAGLVAGVRTLLDGAGAAPAEVSHLLFASTVATNAVLQRSGARIGLIVSKGFRHMLEIGRANIPGRLTNELTYRRPEPLVPLERVWEADERCLADGAVLRGLDEDAARAAIRQIVAQRVECLAVSLLHSYANPAHERRIRAIAAEVASGLAVTLSSDVLPEYREYDRTMTTVLNAYVMPVMERTVRGIVSRLREHGVEPALSIVRSDGGLASAEAVIHRPVSTVLSGPAAGVAGATFVARSSGYVNAVSLDMGGTSTDVSLAAGGSPRIRAETSVGEYPVKIPITDVVTIGAGGGSIAHVSSTGALRVGPRSAGAEPGPVCYDQGGADVTVTDANLFLGRLSASLAGGAIRLNVDRARHAIESLARRLGLTSLQLAQGILTIANEKMLGALRVVSVQRGYDPRDFVLIPFGGAGPMHSGDLCRLLGIRTAVIPPTPGVLSAIGALVSDAACVFARTRIEPIDRLALADVNMAQASLSAEAEAWLEAEAVPPERREFVYTVDLRYVGQAYEVTVPAPAGFTPANLPAAVHAFHAEHRRLYGFDWQGQVPVEMVRIAAAGRAQGRQVVMRTFGDRGPTVDDAQIDARPAYFDGRFVDTPCYARARLGIGAAIPGPAILEQLDCTTVVLPGQTARVDAHLNLLIEEA